MLYTLIYHPDVRTEDVPTINRDLRNRIARAIETRLTSEPERYGEPLRGTLKGYWKLRVGDYRIVFRVIKKEVRVYGIIHRREVYERIARRFSH